MNVFDLDKQYVMPTYARLPVEFVSGSGAELVDSTGKKYIDFSSGIAVNIFGASDKNWMKSVIDQIGRVAHTSNYYYTQPCAKLAELLCEKTGYSQVFFSNSGAEANECAIKAARKYASAIDLKKCNIVTLVGSFHGRTITTLSATGQESMHVHFAPFTEGFRYAVANDEKSLEYLCDDTCAAIMLEIIQGEGGINELSDSFLEKVMELSQKYNMLVIADEIQTGMGRTGTFTAFEKTPLKPDIFTLAKALGGGLPIGATVFSKKLRNILSVGTHGSTFGGNPVCAAGAISIVERIDCEFLSEVNKKSELLKNELLSIPSINSVHGRGLMLGIDVAKPAREIMEKCLENGLLVLTAKERIRLLPPLNISNEQIRSGVKILKEVLEY